ncbi:hybrid sensor histidine kinase/response regulator transcription factor [Rufibacter latericius]|uniref:histidine kinase n=1 Tax=Rufibacter latericius TaxID=2487040 RepID=A0A3M9MVS4_9BACT|nr:substrate-binding domain-containing protein [Rufibacter latericius]RNI29003.1 helix-turn-helix domain-containing protein [Rufibacter latericius]
MKKLVFDKWVTVLLLVLVSCFSSCSEDQETKEFTIGFSQCTEGDAWRKAMHREMLRETSFHPELKLQIKDAKNSSATQVKQIKEFIEQKVDLLIVSPNESEPITPIVEEAFEKGIPVILVDRKISSSAYSAYVGADNFQIGKLAGDYVANLLKGKGKVIEVWGLQGSSPAIERHRGFLEAISQFQDVQVVAEVKGEWEKEVAKKRFPAVYRQHPDADLVFAHNDVMALGSYESLNGLKQQNSLKFIGFDGLAGPNGGLQLVEDGILDATFLYPTGGEEIIQLAYNILHNQPYKKENLLNSTVIDGRNVHIMKQQSNKILSQEENINRQQNKITEQIKIYKNQRTLLYILIISLVIIIVLGAYAVYSLWLRHETNRALMAKNREILQQRNEIAEMAKKAEKANEAKLKFFTNVSHEFRTPLTLILGPVEDALQSNISMGLKKDMLLVRQNALRLLKLVNQLMDFRKVERKKMRLQASESDLVKFVEEVVQSFERLARKRHIQLKVISRVKEINVYFDKDKVDKILFNLLSNSFKFTKENGRITILMELSEDRNHVLVTVEDTGKGMTPSQVANAFDRFYTAEDNASLGTGLGLALSKEFIKLHHGEISVVSKEREGTRFTFSLPLGKEHLKEEEIVLETSKAEQSAPLMAGVLDADLELFTDAQVQESSQVVKEHTILVIEDNKELREFLVSRLATDFNVVDAPQGAFGLQQAFEIIPDLIICDVTLPQKDGLEITALLKKDMRTSHIPVILLTAKDSLEQKIDGIQAGADLYVTKPFSYLYLLERVKGLLRNRDLLKVYYNSAIAVDTKIQTAQPKQLDKKFINDVAALVEKNLQNPDLSANDIAEGLGMSRVHVYRKMKALLGYSLNDYIVNTRLKKARHLLLNSQLNISEIAYEVGFSSPAYFSTAFKNHFNMSPSDFKSSRPGKEKNLV